MLISLLYIIPIRRHSSSHNPHLLGKIVLFLEESTSVAHQKSSDLPCAIQLQWCSPLKRNGKVQSWSGSGFSSFLTLNFLSSFLVRQLETKEKKWTQIWLHFCFVLFLFWTFLFCDVCNYHWTTDGKHILPEFLHSVELVAPKSQ